MGVADRTASLRPWGAVSAFCTSSPTADTLSFLSSAAANVLAVTDRCWDTEGGGGILCV